MSTSPAQAKRPIGPRPWQRRSFRRFFRHRPAVIGLLVIVIIVVGTLVADTEAALQQNLRPGFINQPPGNGFILGTDALGRDVFARTLLGGRYSILVALTSVIIASTVGTAVGLLSGYAGGRADVAIMRAVDVVLSFPPILLLLVVVGIMGPSLGLLIVLIGAITWAPVARIVRGEVLSIKEGTLIEASKVLGQSKSRIVLLHVLPGVVAPVIVFATFGVAAVIITEAILSYLGLGIQPPTPSWGNMLNTARSVTVMERYVWQWMPPGAMVVLMVLAVNFVGDGLRDALDRRSITAVAGFGRPRRQRSARFDRSQRPGQRANQELTEAVLAVKDLSVSFATEDEEVHAVRGITFSLRPGEKLALVGESGSGKSASALALMGLLDKRTARTEGSVRLEGRELVGLSDEALRVIRGADISMVFQDPLAGLNPVLTVGEQIREAVQAHKHLGKRELRERVVELLRLVEIPEPEQRINSYPHQMSGGMRQRVMIAMALSCEPKVLIADEPTTALDVTIQAQILELIDKLGVRLQMAVLFVTHDLGAVTSFADRVAVMYAGRLVEMGPVDKLLREPAHPYTQGLIRATPRVDHPRGVSLVSIHGSPPHLSKPVQGCAFAPRCGFRTDSCSEVDPSLESFEHPEHWVACHHPQSTQSTINQNTSDL